MERILMAVETCRQRRRDILGFLVSYLRATLDGVAAPSLLTGNRSRGVGRPVEPLRMPLDLPLWELASMEASRGEIHALLGEPHFVETDPTRTAGGEEDAWAYALPSGQRGLVILGVPYRVVRLIADPPELEPLLAALGLTPDDPRLSRYDKPFPLD